MVVKFRIILLIACLAGLLSFLLRDQIVLFFNTQAMAADQDFAAMVRKSPELSQVQLMVSPTSRRVWIDIYGVLDTAAQDRLIHSIQELKAHNSYGGKVIIKFFKEQKWVESPANSHGISGSELVDGPPLRMESF